MSGAAQGGADSRELARTLVLNALRDVAGDGPRVVADDSSRDIVRDAFHAAVEPADREAFRDASARVTGDDQGADAAAMTTAADAVLEELAARGVHVTVDHAATLSVSPRDAALYTFIAAGDPGQLRSLDLPSGVRQYVEAGVAAVSAGRYEDAAEEFDRAVSEAALARGGDVTARTLAAYACLLAGDDAAAMDYVEEALHLETRTWAPKLVGLAADDRYPEKFRSGKLGGRVFLRWTLEVPEAASVTASVGPADGQPFQRASLSPTEECLPLPRLEAETRLALRLTGRLPDVPVLLGYYVAYGVVDLEVNETRTAEQLLLSGPDTAGAREQLRFTESPPGANVDADDESDGDGEPDASADDEEVESA